MHYPTVFLHTSHQTTGCTGTALKPLICHHGSVELWPSQHQWWPPRRRAGHLRGGCGLWKEQKEGAGTGDGLKGCLHLTPLTTVPRAPTPRPQAKRRGKVHFHSQAAKAGGLHTARHQGAPWVPHAPGGAGDAIRVLLPGGEIGGSGGHLEAECGAAPGQGGGKDTGIERRWPGHPRVNQGQNPRKDAGFEGRWAARSWKDGEAARRVGTGPGSPGVRRRLRAARKRLAAAREQPGSPAAAAQGTAGTAPPPAEDARRGADHRRVSLRAVPFPAPLPQLPPRSPPPPQRAPARAEPPSAPAAFEATPSSCDLTGNRDSFRVFSNCAEGTD